MYDAILFRCKYCNIADYGHYKNDDKPVRIGENNPSRVGEIR